MELSHEILLESKTVRGEKLKEYSDSDALDTLNRIKAKMLVLASWRDNCWATVEQAATFYEVSVNTLNKTYNRHKDEFGKDVKKLARQELRELKDILSFSPNTPTLLLLSARAMLRLGMLLQESEVAKQVRDVLLEVVDATGRLLEEIASYQAKLQDTEQKIKMYERWIERVRIKDSWIRLCESTERWAEKHPEYLVERKISLSEYLAGQCNALYCIIWGMSKKSICDTFAIPYSEDEIIRDYAPKHHLEMLIKLEETAIELIEVNNVEPARAIQNAGKIIGFRVKELYETEVKKNYRKGTEKEFVRFGFTFEKMSQKPIYLTQEVGNQKLPGLINYLERHKERRIALLTLIADRQKQVASSEN